MQYATMQIECLGPATAAALASELQRRWSRHTIPNKRGRCQDCGCSTLLHRLTLNISVDFNKMTSLYLWPCSLGKIC